MEEEDAEEMLFDVPSSQDCGEDSQPFDSDEEMLDDIPGPDSDVWDPQTDSMPTPLTADDDLDAMLFDATGEADTENSHHATPAHTVKDREWVIARIEGMLEKVVDGLLDGHSELFITLRIRPDNARRKSDLARMNGATIPPKMREISFPGSNAQEAWTFNIYYRHPDLFVKQSVVDRYVDDLAATIGVPRSFLNVTAAAKGLVAGNFIIWRQDGTSVNGLVEEEGILIPKIHSADALDLSSVRWILVIEKEATFRSLLSSPRWTSIGRQSLTMTAKGYPDLASRKFLRQIADHSPCIPIFALMDFDPDGITIMSTYKHGSSRLAHESVTSSGTPTLDLPQIRWLGVQSHQVSRIPATERATDDDATIGDAQGLMRLTARDRRRACRMLEWDVCSENGSEQGWRCELQTMLMLNIKAEMQILEELPGGLISWLDSELGASQEQQRTSITSRLQ